MGIFIVLFHVISTLATGRRWAGRRAGQRKATIQFIVKSSRGVVHALTWIAKYLDILHTSAYL